MVFDLFPILIIRLLWRKTKKASNAKVKATGEKDAKIK